MIPVQSMPEYPEFDAEVRQRGLAFLTSNPQPNNKEFSKHAYWKSAAPQLRAAYSGRCAYTSMKIVDVASVDHFLPKQQYPNLAYEWSNYRYSRQKLNTRKGSSSEVADPFTIPAGFLWLKFPSCLVIPGDHLSPDDRRAAKMTTNVLQLNNDDALVEERFDFMLALAKDDITLQFLDDWFPFLSIEVRRQGIEHQLKQIFDLE